MKTSLHVTALVAALVCATSAQAQNQAGNIQIRAFGTAVLPDGEITSVVTNTLGVPANAQTRASDSVVPTVAVEYFLSPNISIETICCVTPHDVDGRGGINGARLIDNAVILPATVTAKLHFDLGSGVKPYVGAGPSRFFIFGEDVGPGAAGLGVTSVNLSSEWGAALQAGADIALNDRGLVLSLDAKRYFVNTTATFRTGNTTSLQTQHNLDPWVLSAGLGLRF